MNPADRFEQDVAAILGLDRLDAPTAPPAGAGRRRNLAGGLLVLLCAAGACVLMFAQMRTAPPVTRVPIASMEPATEPRIRVPLPAAASLPAASPTPPSVTAERRTAPRRRPVGRHGQFRAVHTPERKVDDPASAVSQDPSAMSAAGAGPVIQIPAPPVVSVPATVSPSSAPPSAADKASR